MSYEEDKAKNERLVKEKAQQIAEKNAAIPVATPVVDNSVSPRDNAIGNVPAPVAEQPVVAPVEQPLSRAEQLMQQLYSTREAAPVHDQAKEDRLVKMGRINQIGRGIGVLGDVLTLGLGGKVNRSQPDRVQPMLYQQYQAMMDKEKADSDAYKYRSFQNDRQNIVMQVGEEHRKEAERYRNAQMNAKTAAEKLKADADWNKFIATYKQRGEQYDATNANNKEHNRISLISATKPTAADERLTRPVTIKNNAGTVTLKPEDAEYLKGKALQNPKLLEKYPTWFTKTEELDGNGDPTGNYVTKLDSRIKDTDLIREQMNLESEDAKVKPSVSNAPPPYVIPGTGIKQTQAAPATKTKPSFFQ